MLLGSKCSVIAVAVWVRGLVDFEQVEVKIAVPSDGLCGPGGDQSTSDSSLEAGVGGVWFIRRGKDVFEQPALSGSAG